MAQPRTQQRTPQDKKVSFRMQSRLSSAKANEFQLIKGFTGGYRNREDITVLPPGIMVQGSQNVLTNTFERLGVRRGYTRDGQSDVAIAPILSSTDWLKYTGEVVHLRAGFNTSGSNGKMQFRYVATAGDKWSGHTFTAGQIYWIDLMTGQLLFVDGSPQIYDWSGSITTLASATANTITKTGTGTWSSLGTYNAGTREVLINGTTYAYTGGESTLTLTGVSPSPAAEPAQSVIVQKVRTTANSAMTAIPSAFKNALIATVDPNQILIGTLDSQDVYLSQDNDYTNYSFSAGGRKPGEGALSTLINPPTGFLAQKEKTYVSSGQDSWYESATTDSADLLTQDFGFDKLKTTGLQSAQSQALITKIKNKLVFLSFEPIINTLGTETNYLNDPQTNDISYPIVNDINGYNFTDGSMIYFKQFVYVAVPRENRVLIYNMTNPANPYWEAPQVMPISRFSVIDGELYGHSYQVGETYKMFNGFNDNGQPIIAAAKFAFNNYGTRSSSKSFNEFFIEGYISQNGTLNLGIQYDVDGCSTIVSYPILGTDRRIVCLNNDSNSLGKKPLGSFPLGGNLYVQSSLATPPKFRVIKTFPRVPFYEEQTSFFSDQIDFRWELIAFGGSATPTSEGNNSITE